jgi:hypothetical protein
MGNRSDRRPPNMITRPRTTSLRPTDEEVETSDERERLTRRKVYQMRFMIELPLCLYHQDSHRYTYVLNSKIALKFVQKSTGDT